MNVFRCLRNLDQHFNFEVTLARVACLSCTSDKARQIASIVRLTGLDRGSVKKYMAGWEDMKLVTKDEYGAFLATHLGETLLTTVSYAAKGDFFYDTPRPHEPIPGLEKMRAALDAVQFMSPDRDDELDAPTPSEWEEI